MQLYSVIEFNDGINIFRNVFYGYIFYYDVNIIVA